MKITEQYHALGGPICLDFIATLRSRTGAPQELLDHPKAFSAWARLALLENAQGVDAIDAADLERALALRETIYRLLQAARNEAPLDISDLETLNGFARKTDLAPQAVMQSGESGLRRDWAHANGCDALLSTIARDAIALLTGPDVNRIKACANTKCERLFYDDSQARRRRWCSMSRCGNQSKLTRYRSRQKSA